MKPVWRQQPFGVVLRFTARMNKQVLVVQGTVNGRYIWYAAGVKPAKAWGPYLDADTAKRSAETWAETHPGQRGRA